MRVVWGISRQGFLPTQHVNTQADFSFMAGKIPSDTDSALSSQDVVKNWSRQQNSAMIGVAVSMHNFQPTWPKKVDSWLVGWRRVTQKGVIFLRYVRAVPPALTEHNNCPCLGLTYY